MKDAKCVLACDIDKEARSVYQQNYAIVPKGNIKDIKLEDIGSFDLLCAGFPCQSFSIAQSKEKKGFEDPRGTLFFEILRIVEYHNPRCILLENVANLTKINNGSVFKTITDSLKTHGYNVVHCILSPHQFGIPQNRERVYIVATKQSVPCFDFSFINIQMTNQTSTSSTHNTLRLLDILDDNENISDEMYLNPSTYVLLRPDQVRTQTKSGLRFCGYVKGELRKAGIRENTEHLSRSHRQMDRIYSIMGNHPTLSASEATGRYHIYHDGLRKVRKLTINECYKLMSYPSDFIFHRTKSVAYRHVGNSVCVDIVKIILKEIIRQGIL